MLLTWKELLLIPDVLCNHTAILLRVALELSLAQVVQLMTARFPLGAAWSTLHCLILVSCANTRQCIASHPDAMESPRCSWCAYLQLEPIVRWSSIGQMDRVAKRDRHMAHRRFQLLLCQYRRGLLCMIRSQHSRAGKLHRNQAEQPELVLQANRKRIP